MGCISSREGEIDDDCHPYIYNVINIDEHGNSLNPGKLEVTDVNIILYQKNRPPIKWPLRTLRRYGFDADHFSFESGRRCQTGPGIYAFRCKRSMQLFNLIQNLTGSSEGTTNVTSSVTSGSNRGSVHLEAFSLRRSNSSSRFSSQNGMSRLSSVGSASGSVGPLSPQSITSAPLSLDTVPLIPPLPIRTISQNLYANENIIAAVTQDLEETNNNSSDNDNNNKTRTEPTPPPPPPPPLPTEHLYLNSNALELPNEDLNNSNIENHNTLPEEVSSPNVDNNHVYMNISPGTEQLALGFPIVQNQASDNFVTLVWEKPEDSMPCYANFNIDKSSPVIDMEQSIPKDTSNLHYIVLDLPSGDPPKSPTGSLPPEVPKRPCEVTGGYAAIDFNRTAALSNSVNPKFDIDSESCRKTRHSSNVNILLPRERHSSSVSD